MQAKLNLLRLFEIRSVQKKCFLRTYFRNVQNFGEGDACRESGQKKGTKRKQMHLKQLIYVKTRMNPLKFLGVKELFSVPFNIFALAINCHAGPITL
jgi:hypothetical protein